MSEDARLALNMFRGDGMNVSIEAKPARRALPPLMALTDGAAERLRALYAKGEPGKFLPAVRVKTKGCSGLACYDLSWVDAPSAG
jgi:iron-sulfur cluster assembly protein